MNKDTTRLSFTDYSNLPVNVCKVSRKEQLTHEHDFTEIEHIHDFTEIVFITSGHGIQIVEEHQYEVTAGDVFVLQGNQKHYFKDASQVEIINVMFDEHHFPEMIPEKLKKLDGYKSLFILEPTYRTRHHFKNMLHLSREEIATIEIILNSMLYEQEQHQEGYDILLINRLQELVVNLSRHYSKIKSTEARSLVRISKVIEYLEENLDDKIYIDKMAEIANMSKRNFQRTFIRALGLSPVYYLQQIRLQKARKLLRETDLQITDIAAITGFTDPNYFIKCFKNAFNTTPHKFKVRFRK